MLPAHIARDAAMARTEGPERKDRFSALDTLACTRETRRFLRRRMDRAFDLLPRGCALLFRSSEEGPRELRVVPGRYAAFLPPASEHPETPGPLARELRRLLSGCVLSEVVEPRGERLLQLRFQRSDPPEPFQFVAELFGSGNILVVHRDRIAAVAKSRRFAGRELRVGAEYRPPPVRPDPFTLSAEAIAASLRTSTKDRVSSLAARLGFGGAIAEEILARAGLDPKAPAAEEPEELAARAVRAVHDLLAAIGESPRGFLTRQAGVLVDAAPYPSVRWQGHPEVTEEDRPTFSEAAEEYFRPLALAEAPSTGNAPGRGEEFERQRLQQERAIAGLELEASLRQAQAEAVFAHYAEAESALADSEAKGDPVVEATLGELRVPLRRGSTPRESAQWLYDEAKRLQAKLAGARAALERTERELAAALRAPPARRAADAPASVRHRRLWFEQYRWFIASGGEIVVAGRDAPSNDQVVRKYLKESDWYVHADLHGAASVVVKHGESPDADPPEESLREAGQFAVCLSKAWRAEHAVGRAFWVEAEKVSKAGGSGEFVARGAWAIHGSKHYLEDLPLELGIGTIAYQGSERLTVAPPAAVRRRGALRFLLAPGPERERATRESELARDLGVSKESLQRLLPGGGLSVRRA